MSIQCLSRSFDRIKGMAGAVKSAVENVRERVHTQAKVACATLGTFGFLKAVDFAMPYISHFVLSKEGGPSSLEEVIDLNPAYLAVTGLVLSEAILGVNYILDRRNPTRHLIKAIETGNITLALREIARLSPEQLVLQDANGLTPLHRVICGREITQGMFRGRSTEIAQALIERLDSKQLSLQDESGMTPLHSAIMYAPTSLTLALIEKLDSEQLSLQEDEFGLTPLHIGSLWGRTNEVSALIEKLDSKQLSLQDKNGFTPLHCAVVERQTSTVSALVPYLPGEAFLKTTAVRSNTPDLHLIAGTPLEMAEQLEGEMPDRASDYREIADLIHDATREGRSRWAAG